MTQRATDLLTQALLLSEAERGDLAARLIESLDPDTEEDVENAWNQELLERIEDAKAGRNMVPWPQARQMIADDTEE
jgi:putative addiction module component (TIGR02574 family)